MGNITIKVKKQENKTNIARLVNNLRSLGINFSYRNLDEDTSVLNLPQETYRIKAQELYSSITTKGYSFMKI